MYKILFMINAVKNSSGYSHPPFPLLISRTILAASGNRPDSHLGRAVLCRLYQQHSSFNPGLEHKSYGIGVLLGNLDPEVCEIP